jgi:two-component system invasion response regulator UvrY
MDGVELTRRLVRELPGIKVLSLSMHIEKDIAAAMREAGAVGYLTKGGQSEDLISAIRACGAMTWPLERMLGDPPQ